MNLGIPLFLIPVRSPLPSRVHVYITSISPAFHSILGQKWCTLYLSLFDPSNQRFHLQISGRRNLNRGICQPQFLTQDTTDTFLLTSTNLDLFSVKIRQRGILKYLIFSSESGPLLSIFTFLFFSFI